MSALNFRSCAELAMLGLTALLKERSSILGRPAAGFVMVAGIRKKAIVRL